MKKKLIYVGGLLALGALPLLQPPKGIGGITGSSHDFSNKGWGTNEICKPCHTPHNAMAVNRAPLWNHNLTNQTFTLYGNPAGTMDANTGANSTLSGTISHLCLSCHDGVTAVDAFGGSTSNSPNKIAGNANLGTNLTNDHPIAFTYDATLATSDGELYNTNTSAGLNGVNGTISQKMLFGSSNNQMECASCHDVHNSYNQSSLLVKNNSGSALCLTCHVK